MSRSIIIGTRGSKLALWQAEFTKAKLEALGHIVELKIIKTKGDKIQHLGFDKLEGKGFFTKELEDALLRGAIDMAVHSMKDLPTTQPEGLVIAGVSYRENPADMLVIRKDRVTPDLLLKLPKNAKVGTSSARRKAQLLDFRSDLELADIRGNVPTRLRKLEEGQFDAIMLAAAGLQRLEIDLSAFEAIELNPREFVPAPAQGVLAFQCLGSDVDMRRILKELHHSEVSKCTNVERKVLKLLEGGCQMPLGVFCEFDPVKKYSAFVAKAENWDGKVHFARFSSSTYVEFAEQIFKALQTVA
ncbi:MAG: hydroxymethylbilane synthase [Bacteroidota bacterium]